MIERILFAAGDERRLALVQRGLAAVIGLRIALGPYRALAGQPDELWRPRGITLLLPDMPSAATILALQIAGAAAALFVALAPTRWRGRRAAMAAAWVSLLVLAGLRTSLGKIMHNDVPLILVGLVLVVSPFDAYRNGRPAWPERSDGRRSPRFGWPVAVATALVAGAYFFCGYQKLLHSGLSWVFSDNMQNVMAWGGAGNRAPTDAVNGFIAERLWLGQALAAATLVIELSFPLVLFRARLRPVYAVVATALHVGVWLTLGLDYWAWIAVDLAVLVDWQALGERRSASRRAAAPERLMPACVARTQWPAVPG